MSNDRICQKDLAEQLKLSQATVSRALANSPLLAEETKKKVRDAAAKIGYVPDPVLASLNAYVHSKRPISRGSVIAWLGRLPAASITARVNEWETTVFQAAETRALQLGYRLEYFWMNDPSISLLALDRVLWSRGIAGLIIGSQNRPHSRIHFNMNRWCAVTVSKTLYSPRIDQVSADHSQEIRYCYRKLLSCGYRRIGLVLSHFYDEKSYTNWRGGYLIEQSRLRESARIPVLICMEEDADSHKVWLKKYTPDCLITAFEGTDKRFKVIKKLGYRVPRDLGVAFLNLRTSPIAETYSGVEEPNEEIGFRAIDLLVSRVRNNQPGVPACRMAHLLEGSWKEGKTVRHRYQ